MKKQYVIEIEESKAETVINLLAQISVTINKPAEKKKEYVKIEGNSYHEDSFLCLTEEQYNLLWWLKDCGYYEDWEGVNPEDMFEEV